MKAKLHFLAVLIAIISTNFLFAQQEVSQKQEYTFHVIQKDEDKKIIGGETYQIRRPARDFFSNS